MTDNTTSHHHTLPSLRHAVRGIARVHRLPAETRARLVMSAVDLAHAEIAAGRPVRLEAHAEPPAGGPQGGQLVVTLDTLSDLTADRDGIAGLPLPAQFASGGSVTWRMPLPGQGGDGGGDAGTVPPARNGGGPAAGGDCPTPEDHAAEQELRAVLARLDALTAEHRRLKHELAETNRGTLALYVQLEERDEQLRKAHGQTLRELEDALRPAPIEVEGLEMAVHYAPAGTDAPTGGDLYDWLQLPDGTVHITVVDALGHGVTSTRGALNVTHAVRTLALEGHPLESIIARTAEILMPFDSELMSTVLLARFNPATGDLFLANGSHPPALLLPAGGEPEYLEVRGRGIGYPLPGSEHLLHARMNPGDMLILYTDGLTESRKDPREGEKRLVEAALRHADRPIAEVPGSIAEDMHTVILHPDDTLALAVRVPPA
ncbi:PP2C family protein-serine/threonine phosphatase [Streptomyces sp. CNQ085]|uniref:PP2C family protein-serine/threonine phosphatase n=1 Tax=Streptomyces sp. CNQ085 TaxID=2886944 RepID=UPI001F51094F|nr:SpoIIE family protein phosphatase [Streptomyces sp. CNQ085]MCI0385035.1 serine/threonine-protein phosphatase [Streptomyces sp. CNQ085]